MLTKFNRWPCVTLIKNNLLQEVCAKSQKPFRSHDVLFPFKKMLVRRAAGLILNECVERRS